jgi:hypothetical protein
MDCKHKIFTCGVQCFPVPEQTGLEQCCPGYWSSLHGTPEEKTFTYSEEQITIYDVHKAVSETLNR